MGVAQRSRRWLVPVTAVAVVAGVAALGPVVADASPDLPGITAQDLLAKVQTAKVDGLSGTVTTSLDLGLPAMPGMVGGEDASQFTDLLTGEHTARVAFAGPDKARVSVLDQMAERVLTTDGKTAWIYDSSRREATKIAVPAHTQKPQTTPQNQTYDPQAVAKQFLAAIDPSTKVEVTGTESVGRPRCVQAAADPEDGQDHGRLGDAGGRLEELGPAAGDRDAADRQRSGGPGRLLLGVVRRSVREHVRLHPAEAGSRSPRRRSPAGQGAEDAPEEARRLQAGHPEAVRRPADHRRQGLGDRGSRPTGRSGLPSGNGALDQLLTNAPTVQGSWGSGKVLTTKMVSALITDDGRVFVGLVTPDALQAAAAKAPR